MPRHGSRRLTRSRSAPQSLSFAPKTPRPRSVRARSLRGGDRFDDRTEPNTPKISRMRLRSAARITHNVGARFRFETTPGPVPADNNSPSPATLVDLVETASSLFGPELGGGTNAFTPDANPQADLPEFFTAITGRPSPSYSEIKTGIIQELTPPQVAPRKVEFRLLMALDSVSGVGISEADFLTLVVRCNGCGVYVTRGTFDYHECRDEDVN